MEKQEKAYKGVIEYFKNRIMAGELRPGEKLPPEREIAQMLEVSRNSVRDGSDFLPAGLGELHHL